MILDLDGISSRSGLCLTPTECHPLWDISSFVRRRMFLFCHRLSRGWFLTLLYADAGVPAVDLDHGGDRGNTDAPLAL